MSPIQKLDDVSKVYNNINLIDCRDSPKFLQDWICHTAFQER